MKKCLYFNIDRYSFWHDFVHVNTTFFSLLLMEFLFFPIAPSWSHSFPNIWQQGMIAVRKYFLIKPSVYISRHEGLPGVEESCREIFVAVGWPCRISSSADVRYIGLEWIYAGTKWKIPFIFWGHALMHAYSQDLPFLFPWIIPNDVIFFLFLMNPRFLFLLHTIHVRFFSSYRK